MTEDSKNLDVIIVGAGASGLMCAMHAGQKGLNVLVVEKNPKAGVKILVSGGGRCNFTNVFADPREQYLSGNPHFCVSAMRRYSPYDFIELVEKHGIPFHEKTLGQQFCDESSKDIQRMMLDECEDANVEIVLDSPVTDITRTESGFRVSCRTNGWNAPKVVIACGGLSLPKVASDLAFRTANAMGLNVVPPRAGLVPLRWNTADKSVFEGLSGISFPATASCNGTEFSEAILFTHRGLSGPAILQISSFWGDGDLVTINCLPDVDAGLWLTQRREETSQQLLSTVLKSRLPNRFVETIQGDWFEDKKIGSYNPAELDLVAKRLSAWAFMPGGSEGYRTAEVTLGGIDTDELSSKTFEVKKVPGLYAIGEAVDVTGWLGGYNFQWAWASGYCCALDL